MSRLFQDCLASITERTARIGVLGLGYVGLPLARAFSQKGFRVVGFDTDSDKVARLSRGESYIRAVPSPALAAMRERGFEATDRPERLGEPDALLLCLPTPLTAAREPDLSALTGSAEALASFLRPGQLVVLCSTTYPGTTRDVLRPVLEGNGLKAGHDFFLAYTPEREDPGNPTYSVDNTPRVVGGLDVPSRDLAAALFARVAPSVVPVSSAEVAEACKILENTYRAVNIALVNELKVLYDRIGIDVWEVLEAAKTKPFGFQAFEPGPGLGGHCIPIDPFYLTWLARTHGLCTRFIELAGEVNTAMPGYVVGRVADALNDRGKPLRASRVLLLGMAYKRNVDDPRESPGFELMKQLAGKGATVAYHDPYIPRLPPMRRYPELRQSSENLTADLLSSQDAVIIVTDHSVYDWTWIVENSALVVDTRNATRGVSGGRERIVRA
jgi:UDP-N-acetyl-D-glucosamine dehydrogenase